MTSKKKTTVKNNESNPPSKKSNTAGHWLTRHAPNAPVRNRRRRHHKVRNCKRLNITIRGTTMPDLPTMLDRLPQADDINVLIDAKSKQNKVLIFFLAPVIWLAILFLFWHVLFKQVQGLSPVTASILLAGTMAMITILFAFILRFTGMLSEKNFVKLVRLGMKFSLMSIRSSNAPEKNN
ncbi:hypothetical protein [Chitinophaga filiformis]|uniref:Uncharacterized protein n=1 Tax=Chitinophaga filiformis TaxID=104663 RepID=A0A1G7MHF3_CHIFI|nr:hypothetical protein [Chitinophaga filiformis]SDF60569.1 hypothetical protein SAMN04488121_102408 [Chitinophaga filiformis]